MGIRNSNLEGSERIYRFLLLLYPPGFRGRFGPEMVQIFLETYPHDVRNVGFAPHLAFWLWTANDLVRSLHGEWRQALTRPDKIELPVRQWADSLVVPLIVAGSLLVAGNLGATLVRNLTRNPTAHAPAEAWRAACMPTTGVAVALGLGILGILSAIISARSRRPERWIKL